MKLYYFPDDKDAKAAAGASEDPTTDATKQNKTDSDKEKTDEIKVPDNALKNYKESAPDTEE